jgi:hypothetical protein
MRVPTLRSAAILPAFQIGSSGASCGASAYWRPFGSATLALNAVASRLLRE